jgi:hypothetical protein
MANAAEEADETPPESPAEPVSPRQMSYLIDLAFELDQPFVLPATKLQASRQITGMIRIKTMRAERASKSQAKKSTAKRSSTKRTSAKRSTARRSKASG